MPLINDPDGLSQGGVTAVSDAVFTGSAGANTTITSAGTGLPAVTAGDFIEIRDHSTEGNNGLYEVTGSPTTGSIALTKHSLTGSVTNPVDAAAEAITTLGTNANEKNVYFDGPNRLFTFLNGFGSTTLLDDEGVTGQAFYSFSKEELKADGYLTRFPFWIEPVTPNQFEYFRGWRPVDEVDSTISTTNASNTRQLLRDTGWSEINLAGTLLRMYFGWKTLGNIDAGDFPYYFFSSQTTATAATFDGPANEGVLIFDNRGIDPGAGYDFTTSTIVRTSGSWVTEGFLVGDSVTVQTANNSANNITAVITNVTALTITVSGTPFTADTGDTVAQAAVDRRTLPFTTRIRVFGKTHDQSTTAAIGVTELTNKLESFPLSEGPDGVITDLVTTTLSDLFDDIITTPIAPYNDMSIAYLASSATRSGFVALAGDTPSPGDAQFGVIVDADVSEPTENGSGAATAEQVYAYIQARLQGTADINNGAGAAVVTVSGQLAEPLLALASTGNTLSSVAQGSNPGGGGTGVKVDSFNSNDTNRVTFVDDDSDSRTFPFVSSGDILFNEFLSTDVDAFYRMYFTNDDAGDNTGRDFGTAAAITVQNQALSDIAGLVPQQIGGSSVSFTYDYDGNVQRGAASSGTDAPITIIASGLSTGQYVIAQGTITRATGLSFSTVAARERNYVNN